MPKWSAEGLKLARKAMGLSQAEVARKISATQAQISQWETGKAEPGSEVVARLEKLLGHSSAVTTPDLRLTARDAPAQPATKRGGPRPAAAEKPSSGGGDLGFEKTLWAAADKLRSNMDAAVYKHVVLGLIFLKYISDAFEERHKQLVLERASGADPEDPDEYRGERIFWVPKVARWTFLQAKAKDPKIGVLVDDAMVAIEKDNPSLKGTLPKDYGRLPPDAMADHNVSALRSLFAKCERMQRSRARSPNFATSFSRSSCPASFASATLRPSPGK